MSFVGEIMRNSVRMLIALYVGSMATTALATPLDDGAIAYSRGDYAEALRILRPVASQGDALAQDMVGDMYASGKGVAEDHAEALRWYCLAAAQGDAVATKAVDKLLPPCGHCK